MGEIERQNQILERQFAYLCSRVAAPLTLALFVSKIHYIIYTVSI